jgi:murein DD-endopeptidase MepM/ murein hydrolase activator NlpD
VPDAPAALLAAHPLTPLEERRRGRARPGRRFGTVVLAGLAIAIAVPLVAAAMAPAAPALAPLTAPVAGAATEPSRAPTAAPAAAGGEPSLTASERGFVGALAAEERRPPDVTSLTGYQWPLRAGRVTLPFKGIPGGEWIDAGRRWHDGVDLASFCGAPVVAAHAGIVLAASRHFDDVIGWVGDLGPYYRRLDATGRWNNLPIVVVIDDRNGYRSIYAHFHDVTVKVGQVVRAGELIGHEGATGHASGCHVHYGLFSPLETRTFGTRADIVRRMKVPTLEVARVDPLDVLPGGDVALRTRSIAKAIAASAQARAAATPAVPSTAARSYPAPRVS